MATSFIEQLILKRAAGQSPILPSIQAPVQAPKKSIGERIKELAAQQNKLSSAIIASIPVPTQKPKKPSRNNPYNGLALFDNNAPDDIHAVTARMVEALGYEKAVTSCLNMIDFCIDNASMEDAHAWEMAQEVIEQMLEKANAEAKQATITMPSKEADELAPEPAHSAEPTQAAGVGESFSLNIVLNERQLAAKDMAFAGKSFCLIGPAGSGKTTAQRSVAASLHESGRLSYTSFKDVGGGEYTAPSIAFVAFTRRAAGNLRKAIHKDPMLADVFSGNIMTIHALLEYAPEYYWDSLTRTQKFRFAPRRTARNPLTITHLVVEEASMVGAYDLWQVLYDALPPGVQIIFIGDINQLPPVFGPSILNYALIQLPIVELVETYRNQGMVLENAHRILRGEMIEETEDCNIVRGNKPIQLPQDTMGNRVVPKLLDALYNQMDSDGMRKYDPEHDVIISPFNKQALGTTNINNWIAQFMGDKRGAIVYEIIAGFSKVYLAVGDKVMVNKRDGVIVDIKRNPQYTGREPQLPGNDLSRFGVRLLDRTNGLDLDDLDGDSMDYSNFSLEELANEEAERKQQASHIVTIEYENGYKEELSGAGDFGDAVFSLGYCLTGHKAQGSEWRRIYVLMHKDHSTMLFREWLYTVYTRGRIGVTIIAKDYLIEKAIKTPRILGNTLRDKLAYFNSGINNVVDVSCTKPFN